MTISRPDFLDSPYYDKKTGKLKKGAPKKVVDEYNAFQKSRQASNELYSNNKSKNK